MLNHPNRNHHRSRQREESLRSAPLPSVVGVGAAIATGRVLLDARMPSEPADAVVFVAAASLVVLAGWFVANVLAWRQALRRGRTVRRFSLPGARRVAQLLLIVSLSNACVADTADGPRMVLIDDSTALDDSTAPDDNTPVEVSTAVDHSTAIEATPTPPPTTTAGVDESSEDDGVSSEVGAEGAPEPLGQATEPLGQATISAHQVIVQEGDNLWALAAEALERNGFPDTNTASIAGYWRLVVAGNQVRSGDANLIVAGETIEMPAYDLAL